MSNTTIGYLSNRSRSGLLCVRVVNSGGETGGISRFTCSVHRGKRAEGSREVLDVVLRSLLRSFFSQKRRQFPHHSATNFQSPRAVIRSWSHVLASMTYCCSPLASSAHLSGQKLLTFHVIYLLLIMASAEGERLVSRRARRGDML
jgi:hypothetical protein